ncbi:hypothetical protein AVEN_201280-1 [Araneus ventricosus]|uniref:Uncharacterized protein n=1 Tax=Araneus ventricosus TaxID=182803 RepID=A0A4Y2WGV7_ARAVE|nr:hypothetical protein AVEN_201280-1 [Araneus ventricosus]
MLRRMVVLSNNTLYPTLLRLPCDYPLFGPSCNFSASPEIKLCIILWKICSIISLRPSSLKVQLLPCWDICLTNECDYLDTMAFQHIVEKCLTVGVWCKQSNTQDNGE